MNYSNESLYYRRNNFYIVIVFSFYSRHLFNYHIVILYHNVKRVPTFIIIISNYIINILIYINPLHSSLVTHRGYQ